MWLGIVCAVLAAGPATATRLPGPVLHQPRIEPATSAVVQGSARAAESANFQIESRAAGFDARQIASSCEQWRSHLQAKWLGGPAESSWNPRCQLVIHARRESYCAAIGRGGEASFGSSWFDAQGAVITARRIDLLVDASGALSALGHELTHVVLADAFAGRQPPPWASEGIAVLADSAGKQSLHARDLASGFPAQTVFPCAELLQLNSYPAAHRIPAFYGQSASLVAWLSRRGGSATLIPFLKAAEEVGYDKALQDNYDLNGVGELHRLWLQEQTQPRPRQQALPQYVRAAAR